MYLFRGEARTYESQRWRVQRFDACETADSRTLAPAEPGVSPKDKSYILCVSATPPHTAAAEITPSVLDSYCNARQS